MKIIELLDKSVSYSVIMEKYGIGKSTVSDVNKSRLKIRCFSREMVEMGMKNKPSLKVMNVSNDRCLDQAVFLWFIQKRSEGVQ